MFARAAVCLGGAHQTLFPLEEVAEGEREECLVGDDYEVCWNPDVETFVPLEGDDFGVFSGVDSEDNVVVEAEGDVARGNEDDVVIEDDDVVIEDDDVQVEELEDEDLRFYLDWQKRNMDKRKSEELYNDIGGDSCMNDGMQKFVWDQQLKAATFWKTQVEVYEGKIME